MNQRGPEALYQIISKRGRDPSPDPSEHKLLTGAAALSVEQAGKKLRATTRYLVFYTSQICQNNPIYRRHRSPYIVGN